MQKYPSFKRYSACSSLPTGKGKNYFPQNSEEFVYHSQSHKCESSEINATNYFHFAPKGEIQLGNTTLPLLIFVSMFLSSQEFSSVS